MKTCLRQVEVYKSAIPTAGNGVWAKEEIPENIVFGPYEGLKVHLKSDGYRKIACDERIFEAKCGNLNFNLRLSLNYYLTQRSQIFMKFSLDSFEN